MVFGFPQSWRCSNSGHCSHFGKCICLLWALACLSIKRRQYLPQGAPVTMRKHLQMIRQEPFREGKSFSHPFSPLSLNHSTGSNVNKLGARFASPPAALKPWFVRLTWEMAYTQRSLGSQARPLCSLWVTVINNTWWALSCLALLFLVA